MVQTADFVEDILNRIATGQHVHTIFGCTKCTQKFIISNLTERDQLLNHMMVHFYAES